MESLQAFFPLDKRIEAEGKIIENLLDVLS